MDKYIKTFQISKIGIPVLEIFICKLIDFNMDFQFTRFEGNLLFFLIPTITGMLFWFLELHFKNIELVKKLTAQKTELEKYADDTQKKSYDYTNKLVNEIYLELKKHHDRLIVLEYPEPKIEKNDT